MANSTTAPAVSPSFADLATDPIRNFKFLVLIDQNIATGTGVGAKNAGKIGFKLGFNSISGFQAQTNAIAYRQGGYNTVPQMIPGQTSFTPVTFERGVLLGTNHDWAWFQQIFALTPSYANVPTQTSARRGFRGSVNIYVLPHPRPQDTGTDLRHVAQFKLWNAWPTAIAFSALNASDNGFLVTSMTLAHEGFTYALAGNNDVAGVGEIR